MKINNNLRERIEAAFYSYNKWRKECGEIEGFAYEGTIAQYGKVAPNSSSGKNRQENRIIKYIDCHEVPKWLYVVERTLKYYNKTGKDTLIELRYFENKSINQILDRLHIERPTMFFWLEDVITYAIMCALEKGLIEMF